MVPSICQFVWQTLIVNNACSNKNDRCILGTSTQQICLSIHICHIYPVMQGIQNDDHLRRNRKGCILKKPHVESVCIGAEWRQLGINTTNAVPYRSANISQTTIPRLSSSQWQMIMILLTGIMHMYIAILLVKGHAVHVTLHGISYTLDDQWDIWRYSCNSETLM